MRELGCEGREHGGRGSPAATRPVRPGVGESSRPGQRQGRARMLLTRRRRRPELEEGVVGLAGGPSGQLGRPTHGQRGEGGLDSRPSRLEIGDVIFIFFMNV